MTTASAWATILLLATLAAGGWWAMSWAARGIWARYEQWLAVQDMRGASDDAWLEAQGIDPRIPRQR